MWRLFRIFVLMIRKQKVCLGCNKPSYIWSKKLCKRCFFKENPPKRLVKTPIKKKSESLSQAKKHYKKAREEFLSTHNSCEVKIPGCLIPNDSYSNEGMQVHHKKGRLGNLLWDKRYFLAICANCHRFITDHNEIAMSNGWSLSRLSEDPPLEE